MWVEDAIILVIAPTEDIKRLVVPMGLQHGAATPIDYTFNFTVKVPNGINIEVSTVNDGNVPWKM